MKKQIARWILGASLLAPLYCAGQQHRYIRFTDVETKFDLRDKDGTTFRVTWRVDVPDAEDPDQPLPPNTFTVKVERTGTSGTIANKIYSLLTLGIQSVDWENMVTVVQPNDANILNSGYVAVSSPAKLPEVDRRWSWRILRYKPVEARIWFVKFLTDGPHLFTVTEGNQRKIGITGWWKSGKETVGDGHDNTPPHNPPD